VGVSRELVSMNKSEQKAYNWLLKQGVKPSDITFRGSRTPDFILADGRGFEVKRLYEGRDGKKIIFSSRQFKSMEEAGNTQILVFSNVDEEPVAIIPVSAVKDGSKMWEDIRLYRWGEDGRKDVFHITVDPKLAAWVDQKVEEKKFASRSHAVDVALMELKRKEKVKL